MMRYLSVCSGIESATLAWSELYWFAVAFAEIDKFASRVLAHHYPDVPNLGDFTAIDTDALGSVDLLVGGTPCQSFSVVGKRLSLADARGNLALAYTVLAHDLARSHGLRWAVWENVPGVLNTPDNAFGCFLGALVGHDGAIPAPRGAAWPDAGMVAGPWARCAWRVLDAQYFGLAQRRRRVFVVVGFGDGADPAAVLFEPQGLCRHPPARGEARQDVAGTIAGGARSRGGYSHDDIPLTASAFNNTGHGYWDEASAASTIAAGHQQGHETTLVAYGGNNTSGPIDVATAVNAHGGPHGRQDSESETFVAFDARQTDVLIYGDRTGPLDTKQPGPAIAFQGRGTDLDLGQAQGWSVRRLMPIETERLQGIPDGYTAIPGASDGARYKTHGNAMAVNVMRWIGGRLCA